MTSSPTLPSRIAQPRAGLACHSIATAVLAVGGTFCLAAAALALWPEPASAASPTEVATAPVRVRCDTCGVIQGIHHRPAAGGAEAFYQFDVRLADGSLRQSRDPQPGHWQVGDRMQLLGGDRTWSGF